MWTLVLFAVHKDHEPNRWRRAFLPESSMHWEQVPQNEPNFCSGCIETGWLLVSRARRHFPRIPPSARDKIGCFLQIYKAHMDWMKELP